MIKRLTVVAAIGLFLVVAGDAGAQYEQHPLIDKLANRVIQKYQNSSCQQLANQRHEPKSPMEEQAIQNLRSDPQLSQLFISKVAAPIANKLFECGLIP
jgi:hypothetical protein